MLAKFLKKYPLCVLLYLGLFLQASAQEMLDTRYVNLAPDLQPKIASFNDGSALTAFTNLNGNIKTVLLKTDPCGDITWAKEVVTPFKMERILDIRVQNNEIYLSAVLGRSYPDSLLLVCKLNEQGQSLWSRVISQNSAMLYWYSFDVNQIGEIFLNGNTNDTRLNSNVVVKLSAQGQIIWSQAYSKIRIWGMGTATSDGGFLKITGTTIYKLAANGTVSWAYKYNSQYQAQVNPLETSDGYLIFTNFIGAMDRSQVFKIDYQGQVMWSSKVFTNSHITGACLNSNDEILLSDDRAGPQYNQLQLMRLSPQGIIEETLLFDASNDLKFLSNIHNNEQGSTYLASRSDINGSGALSVIKVDDPGNVNGNCKPVSTTLTLQNAPVLADANRPAIFGQGINLINNTVTATFIPINLTSSVTCRSDTNSPTEVELGPDTVLCAGQSVTLRPQNSIGGNFVWSTGERSASIEVSTPGLYWLEVETPCHNSLSRDSIRVEYYPNPGISLSDHPQNLRLGDTITLRLKGTTTSQVIWQLDADSIFSGNPWTTRFETTGEKQIKACFETVEGCQYCDSTVIVVDGPQLQMPDAFTPNDDGLNDFFGPPPGLIYSYRLIVYDRLGKRLAELQNQPWDGTHHGIAVSGGVYLYFLHYRLHKNSEEDITRGYLTLLR